MPARSDKYYRRELLKVFKKECAILVNDAVIGEVLFMYRDFGEVFEFVAALVIK